MMMSDRLTVEEMVESLTGFDEIAIAKHFDGLDPYSERNEDRPMALMRALAFVDQRRAGLDDTSARKAVLGLTMREVLDYFPDAEPEPFQVEVETPAGKEPMPPEGQQQTLPRSA